MGGSNTDDREHENREQRERKISTYTFWTLLVLISAWIAVGTLVVLTSGNAVICEFPDTQY